MTKSARIQEKIVDFLADSCPHTVQEIKSFLEQVGISDYSEGQFSGSINTLLRNKSIKKTDRGIYVINQNQGGISLMKTCFVVSPIGDVGSETESMRTSYSSILLVLFVRAVALKQCV